MRESPVRSGAREESKKTFKWKKKSNRRRTPLFDLYYIFPLRSTLCVFTYRRIHRDHRDAREIVVFELYVRVRFVWAGGACEFLFSAHKHERSGFAQRGGTVIIPVERELLCNIRRTNVFIVRRRVPKRGDECVLSLSFSFYTSVSFETDCQRRRWKTEERMQQFDRAPFAPRQIASSTLPLWMEEEYLLSSVVKRSRGRDARKTSKSSAFNVRPLGPRLWTTNSAVPRDFREPKTGNSRKGVANEPFVYFSGTGRPA